MRRIVLRFMTWLLLTGSVLCPQPAMAQKADTVYLSGTVLTMDAENSVREAVAVSKGKILAVGMDAEIRAFAPDTTRVVDLTGKTLLPGFIDAHGHFPESGNMTLYSADLNSPPIGTMKSINDLVSALSRKAEDTPAGEWVVGVGYDDTLLAENRHPTREDLDRVPGDHPIWIFHISLHMGVANSKALELAGVSKDTKKPEGGVVYMDPDTGEPTGLLEEIPAFWQVWSKIPPRSEEQSLAAIEYAANRYAAKGVTTAQNGRAEKAAIRLFEEAVRRGRLPIRVVVLPRWEVAAEIAAGDFAVESSDLLTIGAAKAVGDGSIQGYTGYLAKPYHVPYKGDASYRGYPQYPREKLVEMVKEMHAAGVQMAIHGNGDAAIDDILDAYEAALKEHPNADARPIIIHSQMARDDQLDRMKALGVLPSFFVLHTYYWGDRHRDIFMGPDRAARMSPTRSSIERGLRFTIHCDTPVVPMDPLLLVWSAVNRVSTGGQVIGAAERITPMQALRAVTIDAAWQSFEEDTKGSIEPGKFADLVILAENPLDHPASIRDIKVLETILGGKTVYARD